MAEGGKKGEGDGQIERGGVFRKVSRRQVDQDRKGGEVHAAGTKRCADALAGFADGVCVEAQDLDPSRSGLYQDLDMDRSGFHSPQSGTVDGTLLDVAVELDREVALAHFVSPFG